MNHIYRLLWPPARTRLGPLEEQLLKELWRRKSATVRELIDATKINLAYTTVMTTLDRLYKKRLLDRVSEGKAFRYSPRYSRQELEKAAAGETIRQLLESSPSSALPLSYLVEAVSEHDVRLLDDLQNLVDEKRRELRERDLKEKQPETA
jgi:predicted transcriptional regulator